MKEEEIDKQSNELWELRLTNIQLAYSRTLSLLEQCEIIDYKKGQADCCRVLGYCYWRFSDFSLSLSHSLKGIEIYQKLGDKEGEADILNNIGAVYMFQNDNQKRLEVNLRCQQIRREIGDLEAVSSSEGNIGETYFEMGEYEKAQQCFENVLEDPNASPQGKSWAYHNIGRVKQKFKDYNGAFDFYTKGLDLSLSVSYNVLVTDSYLIITELFLEQEKFEKAIQYAEKGLAVSSKIGAKDGEKKALYYLSKAFELKGEFETSLKYHKDYHSKEIEISRDTEIERLKTTQLQVALDKIEVQKNELVDSIRYAERIQNAILARKQNQKLSPDHFILYLPKDIVSGDFYWYYEKDDFYYVCVADCTGHGVPGAFLTMLGTTYLNEIVVSYPEASPAFILDQLRSRLIEALSNTSNKEETRDGMDISLIRVHSKTKEIVWAGAYNPIWILPESKSWNQKHSDIAFFEDQLLVEIKGDKVPVGNTRNLNPFTDHHLKLEKGDIIYLFSDGFADQFGGQKGKKYRSKQLKQKLLKMGQVDILDQGKLLTQEFQTWKRGLDQVDDVCLVGFRI